MYVVIQPLELVLTYVLRVGRWLATLLIGVMVVIILIQVFFRYALNNALPWPDEAARFLMLWMTGLMAPSAYRWGGFVAIDMIRDMLGRRTGLVLNLAILVISLAVLVVAIQLGAKHVKSGWMFNSDALWLPLDLFGGEPIRIKRAWSFMSLYAGFWAMAAVNVELILKNLHMLFSGTADYTLAPDQQVMTTE